MTNASIIKNVNKTMLKNAKAKILDFLEKNLFQYNFVVEI
ncbi:hypothetical protein oki361_15810 [Helicobacter pylori]